MGRDFISILDVSQDEFLHLIDVALGMKRDGPSPVLRGQTLGMIFEKPSLRTRTSFEMAMHRLGGHAVYLHAHEVQMGGREPVKDVARVLARMVQAIAARTYAHATIQELADYADVPVVNALSDDEHPCQALADMLTLRERFGTLAGVRMAYIGDGNNVATSLAYASVMAGVHMVIASPEGYELPHEIQERARALPGSGTVTQLHDPHQAVRDVAAVYTDVWTSMGQEAEAAQRMEDFKSYQVNAQLIASAPADAILLHDLPAHRGEEITDDVMESPRSVVWDQAENRMHAQQAVLAMLLGGAQG